MKYTARDYSRVFILDLIYRIYFLSIKVYWFLCFEADKRTQEPCKQMCRSGFGNKVFKIIGKSTLAFTLMFFFIYRYFFLQCLSCLTIIIISFFLIEIKFNWVSLIFYFWIIEHVCDWIRFDCNVFLFLCFMFCLCICTYIFHDSQTLYALWF